MRTQLKKRVRTCVISYVLLLMCLLQHFNFAKNYRGILQWRAE